MEKRFEGHLAPHGLYVLDTYSGEVKFMPHGEDYLNYIPVKIAPQEMANTLFPAKQHGLTSFDNEIVSSFPYPVAKPYSELLAEIDPRQKCKMMVDTFTAVLKLMALQIASEYIRAKDVKDIRVNQTLKREIQRPLISAWNNLLMETIPVLLQNNVSFFSPELVRAYEILESKCQNKVMVEKHYEDENGQLVAKRSPLAKIQAMIKYRNSLAHGFNQSRERAVKELETFLPVLMDILQEVRYMARYTLWHVASKEENVEGIRLMGCQPSKQMLKIDRSLLDPGVSPLFLVNESTLEVLPMFTFLDIDISEGSNIAETGKDIFIFDGNTDSTVIYLATASGQHLEKRLRMKHWKELLSNKKMELKMISEKDLDIQKLCAMSSLLTKQTLQSLIHSGKFIPEVTLKRDDLERYLDQFLLGDYGAILIGGESGIGKSTLLADKVIDWSDEGNPVMFYKSSSLNSPDIGQKFIRDMGIKVPFPEEFFAVVDDTMNSNGKFFFLVIDAVNEFNGDVNMLINAIESLVAQGASYRWFRLVVTVRDSSYKRAQSRFGSRASDRYLSVEVDQAGEKVRTNIIPLGRLSENIVGRIYEKYRAYLVKDSEDENDRGYHIFNPLTTFKELDSNGSTVELMKSPLMMRLILQAFNRKELPANLSTNSAMQIYLDEVITEVHHPNGSFPARKNFLAALVRKLGHECSDTIRKDDLLNHNSLRYAVMNPQKDSPYVQLLDLGVLMEEWDEGECYIRFSFDRLFEFLLAEEHYKRDINVDYLKELIEKSKVFKSLEGAIHVIMTRLVLCGKQPLIIELIDGVVPTDDRTMQLIVGFLKTLFFQNKGEFINLIEHLPKDPSTSDLHILSELLNSDLVFSTAETEHLLEIMLGIAEILDDLKFQADVLCLMGNHLMNIGESKLGREKFDEAKIKYERTGDLYGLARTHNLIARILLETELFFFYDDNESRMNTISSGNSMPIEETIYQTLASKENSWYTNLVKAQEISEQIITEESKRLLCSIKINMAYGIYSLRDIWFPEITLGIEELGSEEWELIKLDIDSVINPLYKECIEIGENLADKKNVITAYNNLAAISKDFFDYNNAIIFLEKALVISEEMGSIYNLGLIYWNLSSCKLDLEKDNHNFISLRLKAAEYFKRCGDVKGEIRHLKDFLDLIKRNNNLTSEDEKNKLGNILINEVFDLSNRWFESLTTSNYKTSLNDKDGLVVWGLFEILVDLPFTNLSIFRDQIFKSSPLTQFGSILYLYTCNRMKTLDFLFGDIQILDLLNDIKIEFFKIIDSEITDDEFHNLKSEILKGRNEVQFLIDDNWLQMCEITKPTKLNENEYSEENHFKVFLKYLSWCLSAIEYNTAMKVHGKAFRSYLKELKKKEDQDNTPSQFNPLAILLLGKIVNNKKIQKNEVLECVNCFKMAYKSWDDGEDEFPLAFFYRLITYLFERKDLELLIVVFKKLDEESIKWTEVWPRSAEVIQIRGEVFNIEEKHE